MRLVYPREREMEYIDSLLVAAKTGSTDEQQLGS